MKKKSIIVTVDTEGDNLWAWKPGDTIKTSNSLYIEPFQNLCEKFGFLPVYLTNYEMAKSDNFVNFAKGKAVNGLCEIGMHVHAWNSPPDYELKGLYSGNPYITEYPREIIFKKHALLKQLIEERFGVTPVSYRSGRWATSEDLFSVLEELGFIVDCSVTPGVFHNAPGNTVANANNYCKSPKTAYKISHSLCEVPMTTRVHRTTKGNNIRRKAINILRGERLWLRPALQSLDEMIELIDIVNKEDTDYLMFMIHSSELMPGGSPYCKTSEDVNLLLDKLEKTFEYVGSFGEGILLKDYAKKFLL